MYNYKKLLDKYKDLILKLSSRTTTKSMYSDEIYKKRKRSGTYLLKMYEDQLEMFKKYKKAKVNTARFLRFLIDSYDILVILLKNVDNEYNLVGSKAWNDADFNQFYDYLKKFEEYYKKLNKDEKL